MTKFAELQLSVTAKQSTKSRVREINMGWGENPYPMYSNEYSILFFNELEEKYLAKFQFYWLAINN